MSKSYLTKGSCLCGAVKLSISGFSPQIEAYHSSISQKHDSSAFLSVDCNSELKFVGEENIEVFQSSKWAEHGFCKKCGTHLFYRLTQTKQQFLPVCIFEQDENFELSA